MAVELARLSLPMEDQSSGLGDAGGNHGIKGLVVVVFGKTGSEKCLIKIVLMGVE